VTPKRPYLLNAIHAWLLDNNETPYISVDADEDIGSIPESAVKDGGGCAQCVSYSNRILGYWFRCHVFLL